MKVVVDCHMLAQPHAGDAGNARFHQLLVSALCDQAGPADTVHALIAHDGADALLDRRATRHRVGAGNIRRLALDIPRVLREVAADVAVFSYITPLRTPCPSVVVVHDVSFALYPQWFSRRVRRLLGLLVPRSLRRSAAAITVSERSKRDLIAVFGTEEARVHVVPNVVAPAFGPRRDAHERVADRFSLGEFCLYVGDVHPRKNLAQLAKALELLDRPLELAIVGRAGHRGESILAAAGARWLGPLDDEDLADLYSASAVTCYPSLYEGFGLPVIEAMACGAPVVASNRGAIPEVAGDAAILVEPVAEALAGGIRAALDPEVAARLRAAGPARAAMFSTTAMGDAAWRVLRTVGA